MVFMHGHSEWCAPCTTRFICRSPARYHLFKVSKGILDWLGHTFACSIDTHVGRHTSLDNCW